MALSLSLSRPIELQASLSSLFIEAGSFSLFARFERPQAGHWWEVSRWERGTGLKIIAGPLVIEAGNG